MSIYSRVVELHRFQIESKVGRDATGTEVLDLLYGKYSDDEGSDYRVYHYLDPYKTKSTLFQRFNTLWIVPLFYLSCPFQWLFFGKVGVNQHSKLGKFIFKATGL